MEATYTEKDLPKIARQIIDSSTSKIFLFYGEMGVGKTTLINEIIKLLGVKETQGSPTFSIVNEYETETDILYHFDFYRIENMVEVFDIGLEDYLDGDNYIFMEWPEKIGSLIPENADKVNIQKNKNGSRTIKMMPVK